MQTVITAVGPDHRGLADPIVHHVTAIGANICEIQMYDRDDERLFAMLLRIDYPTGVATLAEFRDELIEIGHARGLTVRVWSPEESQSRPRLALCTTYRPETATAVLDEIERGRLPAEPAVMIGNRRACQPVAERFGVPFFHIGDAQGVPDNTELVRLFDEYQIDYVVLARYMRVLPPRVCWEFAGGRIINLHHGLLPAFPGFRPYEDAYAQKMLTFGATAHFIVPELDAGNQIIQQSTFTVFPGTPLAEVLQRGETENEPACLVEAVRRVVTQQVVLHFHRVVRGPGGPGQRGTDQFE